MLASLLYYMRRVELVGPATGYLCAYKIHCGICPGLWSTESVGSLAYMQKFA